MPADVPPGASAKVYLDYTQAELDAAYDQRVWAPNREEIVAWYGDGERQGARAPGTPPQRAVRQGRRRNPRHFPRKAKVGSESTSLAPIHVHVHGGRWTLFSKDEESFIAPHS